MKTQLKLLAVVVAVCVVFVALMAGLEMLMKGL